MSKYKDASGTTQNVLYEFDAGISQFVSRGTQTEAVYIGSRFTNINTNS